MAARNDAEKDANLVHLEKANSQLSDTKDIDHEAEERQDWTPEEEKKLKSDTLFKWLSKVC